MPKVMLTSMDSSSADAVGEAGVEAAAGEPVVEADGVVLGEAGGEAAGEAGSVVAAGVAGGEVTAGGEAAAEGWDKVGIAFQKFGIWRERGILNRNGFITGDFSKSGVPHHLEGVGPMCC